MLYAIVHRNRFTFKQQFLAIIDETGKRVFKRKLPNDPEQILSALAPYKDANIGIVIESTYNWYWLVDTLMVALVKRLTSSGDGYTIWEIS